MDRLACVDLYPLPLQLLLRRHPEWRRGAVAVVAAEAPHGRILWVNRAARRAGVAAGQQYGEVAGRVPRLHAGVVGEAEVARVVAALTRRLHRLTPEVEVGEGGHTFWLGGRGITPLYASPTAWGKAIVAAVARLGLVAAVAIGFDRFATLATARTHPGLTLLPSPAAERAAVASLPLARLGLPEPAVGRLAKLRVRTVADLIALPEAAVAERFGPEVARLHGLARGDRPIPLQPVAERLPMAATAPFDEPVADTGRLVAVVSRLLEPLLARLAGRGEAAAALHLDLALDTGERCDHRLRPAAPTRDAALLVELVRLRLDRQPVAAGVVDVGVRLEGVVAAPTQTCLLPPHPHRDRRAAEAALARIAAELGDGVVGRFTLHDGHLPEARFALEPLAALPAPQPPAEATPALVRRIARYPEAVSPPPARHRLAGPFRLATGWWATEAVRDYGFARGPGGAIVWLYRDCRTGRWYRQGEVG